MMMSHDEMLDNVAVYALGTLPPTEAAAVVAHLRTCEQCRAEYALLRPAVTAIGQSAADFGADVRPSPLLKARIMREVRNSGRASSTRTGWLNYVAIAAGLAFAIGAVLYNFALNGRVEHDTAARMAAQSEVIADLSAPDAKRYRFGDGTVFVRGSHLYVALPKLAEPPSGKVYQAWTLPKGSKKMAPSITFTPQGESPVVIRLPESALGVTAVAVSVEPAGGSKQPTSKPIAVAAL